MTKKNLLIIASSICLLSSAAGSVYAASTTSSQTPPTNSSQPQSHNTSSSSTQAPAPTQAPATITELIQVTEAWARKSLSPNNNSAAYMKVANLTDKDVVIIGASASETANNVELHKSFVDEKGVSRMTTVDKIVVPAKTTVELAPSGMHVMLFDLKRNLNTGDKFKIELKIEGETKAVVVETEVKEGK